MLNELLSQLKDPSKEIRSAAEKELAKLARTGTLTHEDAQILISSATGQFPKPEYEWKDATAQLIYAARDIAKDKNPEALLQTIKSVFPALSPKSKAAAIQIVVMAHTKESARFYLQAIRDHGPSFADEFIHTFPQDAGTEVANVIYPDILELMQSPELAYPIFQMLLDFREAGLLHESIANGFQSRMAIMLRAFIGECRKHQMPTGHGWKYADDYFPFRSMIGLLFDLTGHLESSELLTVVNASGDLLDPRLRRFRAIALLKHGESVADNELTWIAESPGDRYWLFQQLSRLGMDDRRPNSCLDQTLLAEGNMVDWLCFPTELGREPDEIELIHTETRNKSGGPRLISWLKRRKPVDYFFFKFRVTEEHWSAADGWMVGMSGGYARNEQPTISHDGSTFSHFSKFEEKSLDEHIAEYFSEPI